MPHGHHGRSEHKIASICSVSVTEFGKGLDTSRHDHHEAGSAGGLRNLQDLGHISVPVATALLVPSARVEISLLMN